MSEERVVPSPAIPDVVTCTVMVDGQEIDDVINILSIVVLKEINKIPYAKLVIQDGSPAEEDFVVSAGDTFMPGNEIEIQAGYRSEESTIFKGIIVKHGIKKTSYGPSSLEIECKDKALKITAGRKNRFFYEATDADALTEILSDYDVDSSVESTEATHQRLIQNHTTDWDFILTRAEINGLFAFANDGVLAIKPPNVGGSSVLSLTYGANIISFEAEMDARFQYPAVSTVSWDSANQENLEMEGEEPDSPAQGDVSSSDLSSVLGADTYLHQHNGQVKDAELQSWANAVMLRSRLARIRGWVSFMGFADIKPDNVITLNGLGTRFNGEAYVSAVKHVIAEGNWTTQAQMGIDPECFAKKNNDIAEIPAAGIIPPINGLVIGVVVQLEEDPDGEDRVKIKIPVLGADEEGVWARIACLDAGDSRGTFFRPDLEDEVVIGFLNDDPRDPIILGQLNSSAKPAPFTATDDNFEKGYVSREELKQVFNDELKSIEISTPNGNKILLSEDEGAIIIEDENSNVITLNSDGITMESQGDINISAGGDVNIEGTNVKATASAEFKAEGSAGAEVSSGGTMTVKGSLVQIN